MAVLTKQESEQVAHKIAQQELRTAGELVVATVPQSADYAYPRAVVALASALSIAWLLYLALPTWHSGWFFGGIAVAWWLLYALCGVPWVLRVIVPKQMLQGAVDAKIKQLFIEQGVTETRDRSGVLLLLSEAERRVQLLADRGIHERVGEAGWQHHVQQLATAVHEGRAAAGLMTALEAIGDDLAQHFPPRPDDTNELPDVVQHLE